MKWYIFVGLYFYTIDMKHRVDYFCNHNTYAHCYKVSYLFYSILTMFHHVANFCIHVLILLNDFLNFQYELFAQYRMTNMHNVVACNTSCLMIFFTTLWSFITIPGKSPNHHSFFKNYKNEPLFDKKYWYVFSTCPGFVYACVFPCIFWFRPRTLHTQSHWLQGLSPVFVIRIVIINIFV